MPGRPSANLRPGAQIVILTSSYEAAWIVYHALASKFPIATANTQSLAHET
jgi:hypothetical protein